MSNEPTAAFETGFDYFLLDVFTDTKLQGNQLAVVLHSGTLTGTKMQAIAREMNLSETAFIERSDATTEAREGVRVRIFTTEEELPFAGHPTLGTASLLRALAPECMEGDTLRLALKVGSVPVHFQPQAEQWPVRGTMIQRDPEFGQVLDPAEVARLTGLRVEDFDETLPIQVVSTGTAFAIVPLRSSTALDRLQVRQKEAADFLRARGARWFYVLGPEPQPERLAGVAASPAASEAMPAWRARMQFHGGEDPATGSAAGCAISQLVRLAVVDSGQTIHLRQGVEIGRPSDLFASAQLEGARVSNVRVSGSTVLVAKGRLFLP